MTRTATDAPRGPRVVPGTYQLKLTVDGNTLTQPLKLTMDPRAQVTTAELNDQLRVGLDIFNQLRDARKVQSEIGAVKKHIAGLPAPFLAKHQQMLAEVTNVNAQIEHIEKGERGRARIDLGPGLGGHGIGSRAACGGEQ